MQNAIGCARRRRRGRDSTQLRITITRLYTERYKGVELCSRRRDGWGWIGGKWQLRVHGKWRDTFAGRSRERFEKKTKEREIQWQSYSQRIKSNRTHTHVTIHREKIPMKITVLAEYFCSMFILLYNLY